MINVVTHPNIKKLTDAINKRKRNKLFREEYEGVIKNILKSTVTYVKDYDVFVSQESPINKGVSDKDCFLAKVYHNMSRIITIGRYDDRTINYEKRYLNITVWKKEYLQLGIFIAEKLAEYCGLRSHMKYSMFSNDIVNVYKHWRPEDE